MIYLNFPIEIMNLPPLSWTHVELLEMTLGLLFLAQKLSGFKTLSQIVF